MFVFFYRNQRTSPPLNKLACCILSGVMLRLTMPTFQLRTYVESSPSCQYYVFVILYCFDLVKAEAIITKLIHLT